MTLTLACFSDSVSDCSITKFLNRILGLEVHKQNSLFQYFTDNFDYLIEKDKKEGKYDMGILGMSQKGWKWKPRVGVTTVLVPMFVLVLQRVLFMDVCQRPNPNDWTFLCVPDRPRPRER